MTRQQRQGLVAALALVGLILSVFASQVTDDNAGLIRASDLGLIAGAVVAFALLKRGRL